ncbi:FKBP-type peptidyl-prolyl cis-trans isomerase [Parabacteroides sp.]
MKKYLQFALMIFCLSVVFTSCKDDDKDDGIDEAWKAENEAVFQAKANDPDFMQVKINGAGDYYVYAKKLQEGNGDQVYYTNHVNVYYRGWLATKTRDDYFDKREFEDGDPATFALSSQYVTYNANGSIKVGSVITGWTIALQNMKVGDKWEIWIPQQLGYGAQDNNDKIPPYSTLVFEIEVKGIAAVVGGK